MNLSKDEIEFIDFLYNYRLECEIESKTLEFEDINFIRSLKGNYKEMFDFSNCYHKDERLTKCEKKIIDSLYQKFQL